VTRHPPASAGGARPPETGEGHADETPGDDLYERQLEHQMSDDFGRGPMSGKDATDQRFLPAEERLRRADLRVAPGKDQGPLPIAGVIDGI
jgi:hypothetical protein